MLLHLEILMLLERKTRHQWSKDEKESLRSLFKHNIARAEMPKRDGVKRIVATHEVLKTSPLSKVMQWIKGQVDKVKLQRFV